MFELISISPVVCKWGGFHCLVCCSIIDWFELWMCSLKGECHHTLYSLWICLHSRASGESTHYTRQKSNSVHRNEYKAEAAILSRNLLCYVKIQKMHKHMPRHAQAVQRNGNIHTHTLTLLLLRVGDRGKGLTFIDWKKKKQKWLHFHYKNETYFLFYFQIKMDDLTDFF